MNEKFYKKRRLMNNKHPFTNKVDRNWQKNVNQNNARQRKTNYAYPQVNNRSWSKEDYKNYRKNYKENYYDRNNSNKPNQYNRKYNNFNQNNNYLGENKNYRGRFRNKNYYNNNTKDNDLQNYTYNNNYDNEDNNRRNFNDDELGDIVINNNNSGKNENDKPKEKNNNSDTFLHGVFNNQIIPYKVDAENRINNLYNKVVDKISSISANINETDSEIGEEENNLKDNYKNNYETFKKEGKNIKFSLDISQKELDYKTVELLQFIFSKTSDGNVDYVTYREIVDEKIKNYQNYLDSVINKDKQYNETKQYCENLKNMIENIKYSSEPLDPNVERFKLLEMLSEDEQKYYKMGFLTQCWIAIRDFFVGMFSHFYDEHTARAMYHSYLNNLVQDINGYAKAKTQEEREMYVRKFDEHQGLIMEIFTNSYLDRDNKKQEALNDLARKTLLSNSIDIKPLYGNLMTIFGSSQVAKALPKSSLGLDVDKAEQKKAYILDSLTKKFEANFGEDARFIANGFLENKTPEELSENSGIDVEKIKNCFNGQIKGEFADRMNSKMKDEYEANDAKISLIRNQLDVDKKYNISQKINSTFEDVKDDINDAMAEISHYLTEYHNYCINFGLKPTANQNIIRVLKEKINMIEDLEKYFKGKIKYIEDKEEVKKQIEEKNKEIEVSKKQLAKWKKQTEKEGKLKDNKMLDAEEIQGYLNDIENPVEVAQDEFEAFQKKCEQLKKRLFAVIRELKQNTMEYEDEVANVNNIVDIDANAKAKIIKEIKPGIALTGIQPMIGGRGMGQFGDFMPRF